MIQLATVWDSYTNLPELDVEQRGVTEVSYTLDVEDLLDLGSSLYQWFHWFALNIQLCLAVKNQTNRPATLCSAHTGLQSRCSLVLCYHDECVHTRHDNITRGIHFSSRGDTTTANSM